jgi:hypothetical protein
LAKAAWCLEQVAHAQDQFLRGFAAARDRRFHPFWLALERVETTLSFLEPHFDFEPDQFHLRHMQVHVPRFQSIFPYKLFISPGMIVRRRTCSICGQPFLLRGGCEHVVGEVYLGEMCCRRIEDIQPLEVSLVTNPVQKYSVALLPDNEYDFGPVDWVASTLGSAWDGWEVVSEEAVVRSERFPGASPRGRCPCGSKKRYAACCRERMRAAPSHEFCLSKPPEQVRTLAPLLVRGRDIDQADLSR